MISSERVYTLVLACLLSCLIGGLLSCRAALLQSGERARLSVSISVYGRVEGYAASEAERRVLVNLARGSGGGSRFIHPDTRFVSVSVSGGGLQSPIVVSTEIAAGESAAALSVEGLTPGKTYTVTASAFDGPGGSALSAASVEVATSAGNNPVALALLPVGVTDLEAGPAGTEWAAGADTFAVYRVSLPAAGDYQCSAGIGGQTPLPLYGLYGPDGAQVAGFSTNPSDAAYGRFSAEGAGYYYLAVSRAAPDALTVKLDVRFSYAVLGRVNVIDSTYVRDANLPVLIDCSVPVSSPTIVAGWEGGTTLSTSGSRIVATRSGGFTAETGTSTVPVNLTVVDGVLGATRTISFDRSAFKRFIYLEAGGINNDGPYGDPAGTLAAATETANNDTSDTTAIVLPAGTNVVEGESEWAYASKDMLIIGGCAKAAGYWFKDSGGGRSTVTYPSAPSFIFNGRTEQTIVSGIDFRKGFYAGTSQASLVGFVSSSSVLYDCSLVMDGFNRPDAALDFSVINSDASSVPFIRSCRVEIGSITQTLASTGASVYGIRANGGLTLVSSVVKGATLGCSSTVSGTWGIYGVGAQLGAAGNVVIVGSTVYAGRSTYADNALVALLDNALLISNGSDNTWLYNSIFLVDTVGTYDNPIAIYSAALFPIAAIENSSFTDTPYIMYFAGTPVDSIGLNNGGTRVGNVAYSNAVHDFVDFAAGDYRLTAGSPSVLRGGGLDIFGTPLSALIQNAAVIDPAGTVRTANGAWSIGAYEY